MPCVSVVERVSMAVRRLRRLAGRAALPLLLLALVLSAGCDGEQSLTSSQARATQDTTSLLEVYRDTLLTDAVEEACVRAAAALDGRDRAAWRSECSTISSMLPRMPLTRGPKATLS